jgi:two-component system, OmpR family, KDP operon response regulator KdpE
LSAGKILFVDDEPQIRRVMRATLSKQGYEVVDARTGKEALFCLKAELPHLLILDINLPDVTGIETCRMVRASSEIPIIMLSVRNTERDKVQAFDAGADDYVTKPFSTEELLARIRAVMRRMPTSPNAAPQFLRRSDLKINFEGRQVVVRGSEVHLTPKEFDLLHYLVTHAGQTIRHRRLLQAVWGPDYGGEIEYLRVFINQLRKKIESDTAKPKYILTEPWVGYRFIPMENPDSDTNFSERTNIR